jgi:hypothetical protein
MKKLIAATIGTVGLLLAVGTSYGQGTLSLNNYDSGMGLFDGPGRTSASASPAGTQVQVLAGPTAGSLVAVFNVSATPTSVFTVTAGDVNGNGANTGSFFDFGYGKANNVAPSTVGFIQIIAWHGAASFAAAQTTAGAWWGVSAVFSETFGTFPAAPNTPVPAALAIPGQIQLNAPEPATLALGGLGAAALLLFRRRK